MPRYLTGLVSDDYGKFPKFPYKARNWSFELITTALSRRTITHVGSRRYSGREIVIRAENEGVAAKGLFLAEASLALLNGGTAAMRQFGLDQLYLIRLAENLEENVSDRTMLSTRDIPLACMIAIWAARRKCRVYAIANLWLSYRMFSIEPMDLEPGQKIFPRMKHPAEKICLANALLLASMVLEWLGLNVRGQSEEPKFHKWQVESRCEG